jgi:catechol 2,3-dioxygenase-like lactoylglutathione lyase family enzyme
MPAIAGLTAAGVEVTKASADDAGRRCARRLVRLSDPCGNRLELYVGRAIDYAPLASAHGLSGFVTGDMGMGHVVLPAPQLEVARSFYKQHLGFDDTDEMWLAMSPNPSDPKLGIYFMHAGNPRHHSLALMGAPMPSGCVHIMLEARSLDDVGARARSVHGRRRAHQLVVRQAFERLHAVVLRADSGRLRPRVRLRRAAAGLEDLGSDPQSHPRSLGPQMVAAAGNLTADPCSTRS